MLSEKLFSLAHNGAEAILWLLILLSVFCLAALLERGVTLGFAKRRSRKVQQELELILESADLGRLERLAETSSGPEGKIGSLCLKHLKTHGPDGLQEMFNSFVLLEKKKLERHLNFLGTLGSNAPFIGLLGTVLGIMKAFNDLGIEQNAASVMTGIAEALVATAVGLLVAIPAVVAYNYFQRQIKNIVTAWEALKEMWLAHASTRDSANGGGSGAKRRGGLPAGETR